MYEFATHRRQLRAALRAEPDRWIQVLRVAREVNKSELSGMIGTIGHLAYHLGSIRQINRRTAGPADAGLWAEGSRSTQT